MIRLASIALAGLLLAQGPCTKPRTLADEGPAASPPAAVVALGRAA